MRARFAGHLVTLLGALNACAEPALDDAVDDEAVELGVTYSALAASDDALLKAKDKVWTYIEFPDTTCRDGSRAGLAVRKNAASKKLMIFMEGGGICFNKETCAENPANTQWQRGEQLGGVFDRNNAANPVKDWNVIYIPYCSGDLHGGAKRNVTVSGVGTQQFVGALNMKRLLQAIVPAFSSATDVLLTGVSAGGLGASMNAVAVQDAFPRLRVRLVDDSGPLLGSVAAAPCMQRLWRSTFGYDQTFLLECGSACPKTDDYLLDYMKFIAANSTDRPTGLIETAADEVIAAYYGISKNSCANKLYQTPMTASEFRTALLAYRTALKPYPAHATYFPAGTQHTWLADGSFYSASVAGKRMTAWVADIINGKAPGNYGP
jgi:Pectinacetylesterase